MSRREAHRLMVAITTSQDGGNIYILCHVILYLLIIIFDNSPYDVIDQNISLNFD